MPSSPSGSGLDRSKRECDRRLSFNSQLLSHIKYCTAHLDVICYHSILEYTLQICYAHVHYHVVAAVGSEPTPPKRLVPQTTPTFRPVKSTPTWTA